MPASDAVIGRVAVKVLPDTREFRRDAERSLERIEKTLKVSIPTTIDMTGAKREMLEEVRKLNQENRMMESRKIRFHSAFATNSMNEAITKAVRQLQARADQRKIKFQIEDLSAKLTFDNGAADVVERELEHWREDHDPLEVGVSPRMNHVASGVVAAGLAYLTRMRFVSIVPILNSRATAAVATSIAALSGARAIQDIFENIWDSVKNLDKAVPKIALVSNALVVLYALLSTGVSNTLAFSYSIAQLSGVLLAAPGVIAGVGIALGFTIYAFTQATKEVKALGREFVKLLDLGVKEFWEEAEKPLKNMTEKLFPELERSFKSMGQALGSAWGELFNQIGTQFEGKLEPMFDNLTRAIDIGKRGIADWVGSIVTLGTEGSQYLPRMSKWFNKIGEDFNNWLTKISKSGELKEWINTGLEQLSELGRVFQGLFGVFKGLATAAQAGGGSTFTMVADTLERISKVVNGPKFQKVLAGTFRAAHEALSLIADISGPAVEKFFLTLAKLLQTILPIVGETVGVALDAIASALSQPAVTKGITSLFQGLSRGIKALAPALKPVGQAIGAFGKPLGALAGQLGKSLAVALKAVAEALQIILPRLTPIIKALGQGLRTILEAIAPILVRFAKSWGDAFDKLSPLLVQIIKQLAKGIASLLPPLEPLIPMFFKMAKQIMPILAQVFLELAQHVFPQAVEILKALVPVIKDVMQGIIIFVKLVKAVMRGDWSKVWELVKRAVKNAFDFIKNTLGRLKDTVIRVAMAGMKKIISAAWNWIKDRAKEIWQNIKEAIARKVGEMVRAVREKWQQIRDFLGNLWNALKQKASELWQAIREKAAELLARVLIVVKEKWGKVMEFFRDAPGKIRDAFNNAKDILLNAGRNIIEGLLKGIGEKFGAVKDKLQSLTKYIPDWKGPRDKDRVLLYEAGQLIMEGLVKGLDSRIDKVRGALKGLTDLMPKSASKALEAAVGSGKRRLLDLLAEYEKAADRVSRANEKLKALQQESKSYAQGVRDSIIETGNFTGFEDFSFDGIIKGLTDARDQAREFASVLKALAKQGLSSVAIDQIAQAGPEAGLSAAQALIAAGKAGIEEVNKLQQQIANAAKQAGGTAADSMYQDGIDIAKGLAQGLEKGRSVVVEKMRDIARDMVKAIKQELKIASPSKVFKAIGGQVGDGMVIGLDSKAAAVRKALLLGVDKPAELSARISGAANTAQTAQQSKVFNYYAAAGSSLGAEEDLFAAMGRSRAVGW